MFVLLNYTLSIHNEQTENRYMKIDGEEYNEQELTDFFLNSDNYCTIDDGASIITGEAQLGFSYSLLGLAFTFPPNTDDFFNYKAPPPSLNTQTLLAIRKKLREDLSLKSQKMGALTVYCAHLYGAHYLYMTPHGVLNRTFPSYGFIHAYYLDYYDIQKLIHPNGTQLGSNSLLRFFPPREEVDLEELKRGIDQVIEDWTKPPEWLKSFPFVPLKKDRLDPPPYFNEAPIDEYEAVEAIDLIDLERTHQEEAIEGELKPRASDPEEQAAPQSVFPNGVSVDLIMRCLDQKSPDYLGNLDVVVRLIDKRHKGEFETTKAKRLGVNHQITRARAIEKLIQEELGLNEATAKIRGDSCRRVAFPAEWIPDK